jgi:type VI secretion system protein ImpE
VQGTWNGEPFASLEDADPRVGARLEIFAAGQYTWLPLEHVSHVTMQEPRRLRDLLWSPALVQTGPGFEGMELGEVLLPVLTPEAWTSDDADVRLGRVTDWREHENGSEIPIGQKVFLIDGREVPILELRELVITGASPDA